MPLLAGKRVLITRAASQFETVAEQVQARGASAISFPCLAVQYMPDQVRKAISDAPADVCILLTSANGARCLIHALGNDISTINTHPVVAVGPQTAAVLNAHGIDTAWVADKASQEGLIDGFTRHGMPEEVCFLRAEQGRDVIQKALETAGVRVRLVTAYRTVCPADDASPIIMKLKNVEIDAVLLGSSRCAEHYVQRIGDAHLANRPAIAVISSQVARAAEHAGLSVQCVAKEASFAGILDSLAAYFVKNSCVT